MLDGKIIGVIELKDQKSKNLDAIEAQAFGYHTSHSHPFLRINPWVGGSFWKN
jgi:hypothetical protein